MIRPFIIEKLEIYKILMVGLEGEEKGNFVKKNLNEEFSSNTKNKIGFDFILMNFSFEFNGKEHIIGFQLWDMSEKKRFKPIRKYYLAGTQGFILCVTTADKNEINYLHEWVEDINKYIQENVPKILIRIAKDLKEDKILEKNKKEIQKFMKKWQVDDYFEIFITSGENISKVLEVLAKLCDKYNLIS